MRIETPPPGALEACMTCTPATRPTIACSIVGVGAFSIPSRFAEPTAPVTSRRRCVP
jgi:hypothetical protein